MRRFNVPLALLHLLLLPVLSGALRAQEIPTPNILPIITDDLGHGDLGITGARDIRTPHLDALARQGIRFTLDRTATIATAAGVEVPREAGHEGMNLLPTAMAQRAPVERTLFWRTRAGGVRQEAVRDGDWKLLVDGPSALLFNVRKDPGETRDLASQRPEVARRLALLLREWNQSVDADPARPAR